MTSAISEAEPSVLGAARNRPPVSTAIVVQLCESSRCVHEVVGTLGLPQPPVNQHLRIFKAPGVVAGDRVGREVRYRLVDKHLADIVVAAVTHAAERR